MSRPESVPDPETDTAGAFRELRQYSRGELDVDHRDVHPSAGLIDDDDLRQVLGFMADVYDRQRIAELANDARRQALLEELREDDAVGSVDEDTETLPERFETDLELVDPLELPADFWRTDFAQRTIRKHATDVASKAIAEGNQSQVSFITGLPSYDADISGLHAIDQLADWLIHSEQCKLVYLAALMGRGKTDLALTFLQVIERHYRRIREAVESETTVPEFAANFEVETSGGVEVLTINNYDDLLEWAERGSSDDERWFIFDEASTELTAQSGKNAQKVAETMSPFVKKMRKMGVNMIVIGHDKRDVHVAIRSMADFVDKTGLKTATFYAGIKKREPVGELFSVSGIPPTDWTFDTDDMAEWDWGSAVDEDGSPRDSITEDDLREIRDERMARLYELTELTQDEIGTAFDVSRETVRRASQKFDFERTEAAV